MTRETNNSLFNENVKNSFLKDIKSTTRTSYNRIFIITQKYESALEKDINIFSLKELETIFYDFKANNRNTIESYARIISSYLNWSVENGLTKDNVLKDLAPTDFEKYISDDAEYISDSKLRRLEDQCANFQDAVILRLLFNGVGSKRMSEVSNMLKTDINFENGKIKLTETLEVDEDGFPLKFTERFLDVDERTLYLIEGAINQKIYMKKNGEMEQVRNVRTYTDLVDNKYVIRPSITKNDNVNSPTDRYVLYRRLQMLSQVLDVDKTFSSKYLQRSGMLYYANQIISNEEVTLSDLKMIANRFNVKTHHNLKSFITIENIRKVYPIQESVGANEG